MLQHLGRNRPLSFAARGAAAHPPTSVSRQIINALHGSRLSRPAAAALLSFIIILGTGGGAGQTDGRACLPNPFAPQSPPRWPLYYELIGQSAARQRANTALVSCTRDVFFALSLNDTRTWRPD
ncbi:hypothetical protein EVAR_11655_1 [Eumeta japonica]|uniref:Uncharacterized protein n=1 Tax=Eumeta variegata TaxID=151549 RepID=A0A4C1WUA7_EUMVA|nr:hypothetical protein EVAR_11655_1 [Eumeta japonica]